MKKIFIALSAITIIACNSGEEKTATSTSTATPSNMHGYTPVYSASFTTGDGKKSEIVLELWRAWENGDLSPTKARFADSVSFYTYDGSLIAGHIDSAFAAVQQYRNMFSAAKTELHAITALKSTDKNEDWVTVWGMEYQTYKDGKKDTINLHESWRFNKDNKIDLMYQYMSRPAPMAPGSN